MVVFWWVGKPNDQSGCLEWSHELFKLIANNLLSGCKHFIILGGGKTLFSIVLLILFCCISNKPIRVCLQAEGKIHFTVPVSLLCPVVTNVACDC